MRVTSWVKSPLNCSANPRLIFSMRAMLSSVAGRFTTRFIRFRWGLNANTRHTIALIVGLGWNKEDFHAGPIVSVLIVGKLSVDFFDFVPTGTLARKRCFSLRCRRSAFWYPTNPARAVLAIHPNVRRLFLSEETRRVAVVADIHLRLLWRQLLNQIVLRQNFPDSLPES